MIFLSDASGNYSMSLANERPHPLGGVLPFPDGRYFFVYTKNAIEIRDSLGKLTFSLTPDDGTTTITNMAPKGNWLAVTFANKESGSARIDAFQLDTGRRSALVPTQPLAIDGLAWLSSGRLVYSLAEGGWPGLGPDNLWFLNLNPATETPTGPPARRTRWADFQISQLSANADERKLYFLRSRFQQNIWIGALNAKASRLSGLRRFTNGESIDWPWTWTGDSKAVVFTSDRAGSRQEMGEIYKQSVDSESAEALTPRLGRCWVPRLSPDGNWLLYQQVGYNSTKTQVMRIPIAGGEPQQMLVSEGFLGVTCSRAPGGECAMVETDGKKTTVSLFDPIKGRGARLFRDNGALFAAISPDGKHFAYLVPEKPQKHIRITDLHGVTEAVLTVQGAEDLQFLDWSADSSGFFTSDMHRNETRLLHAERSGTSHILWRMPGLVSIWGVPSPDGRYLATYKGTSNGNAWVVENP
jgi:hypothetical protein